MQLGNAMFCYLEVDGSEVFVREDGITTSVRAFDANHCPGEVRNCFFADGVKAQVLQPVRISLELFRYGSSSISRR